MKTETVCGILSSKKDGYFGDEDVYYLTTNSKELLEISLMKAFEELGLIDSIEFENVGNGTTYNKYVVPNISIQIYASEHKQSLDQLKEYQILDSLGLLDFEVDWLGHSEFTIDDFSISNFTIGGHDIMKVLETYIGKFVYIIITQH